jgi:hypothetical protein
MDAIDACGLARLGMPIRIDHVMSAEGRRHSGIAQARRETADVARLQEIVVPQDGDRVAAGFVDEMSDVGEGAGSRIDRRQVDPRVDLDHRPNEVHGPVRRPVVGTSLESARLRLGAAKACSR